MSFCKKLSHIKFLGIIYKSGGEKGAAKAATFRRRGAFAKTSFLKPLDIN